MNKIIITFLLLTTLLSCSYRPILGDKKYDFQISNINFEGENKLNNIIKKNLKNNVFGNKKYDLFFITNKKKEVVTSNDKGKPLNFRLNVNLEYQIFYDNKKILKSTIVKQEVYENKTDKFELSQDEENILLNLSEELSNDLLMAIVLLNNDS